MTINKKFSAVILIICLLFQITIFAQESLATMNFSESLYAGAGENITFELKVNIKNNTNIQGVQIDFEFSDNYPELSNTDFEIVNNTTGWTNIGITKKNLLAVGGINAEASEIQARIHVHIPDTAKENDKYILKISDAVCVTEETEINIESEKQEFVITIKGNTAQNNNAGTSSHYSSSSSHSNSNASVHDNVSAQRYDNNNVFSDVLENDWFYSYVKTVYEKGLMKGISDTEFAPNEKLTRAMFVTILYRVDGEPDANQSSFTDVETDSWYAKAVAWASINGIVQGVSNTEFAPNTNITREQMAAIIFRYAKFKGIDTEAITKDTNILSHNDVFDVSDWASEAMHYCIEAGIINGDENGSLLPKNNATRAESAAIFARIPF